MLFYSTTKVVYFFLIINKLFGKSEKKTIFLTKLM